MKALSNICKHIERAPVDPILGTQLAYRADKDPRKVDLGVGAARDDNGKPMVFNVVRKAEKQLAADLSRTKQYIPTDGLDSFVKGASKLLFGAHPALAEGRIASLQTLSGTGSLRIGFEFVKNYLSNRVLVSNPTWGNHHGIIKRCGLQLQEYPYFDNKTRSLDEAGLLNALNSSPQGTVVLLHACTHNPTGVDPSQESWKKIADVMKNKQLIPYFDSAYQGFASGDVDRDAWAIRYFLDQGFQMLVSQSFAKNMGLYGERVGTFQLVCSNNQTVQKALSHLYTIIRHNYLTPPLHGASIASKILNNPEMYQEWLGQLKPVSERIIKMRRLLREQLQKSSSPGTWQHITSQIGMFSYLGLTEKQCDVLTSKHHIYLIKSGARISVAGINSGNVKYIAQAIKDAVTTA